METVKIEERLYRYASDELKIFKIVMEAVK
jgi:hypothetical protein